MYYNASIVSLTIYLLIAAAFSPARKIIEVKDTITTVRSRPDLNEYIFLCEDDFNKPFLNRSIWNYRQEGYTTPDSTINLRHNAKIKNGNLYLVTNRYQNKYSGVNITTVSNPKYNFKYGYYEIRAKLPKGKGNVAAFWFQAPGMSKTFSAANPSIHGAEIDVLEYSATSIDNIYHSLHWNGYDIAKGAKNTISQDYIPGISNGYHTFALEWTPKEYVVYVDNVEKVRTNKIISHTPEFLILGCGTGGFGGPNRSGPWPDTFTVDYIKIYKRKPEVRLYEHCDGYGWISDGLKPGTYTSIQLAAKGVFNNKASSCEVPDGWKVTAFDGDNFTGDSLVMTADNRCFDSLFFKNRLSSLKISSDKNR